MHFEILGPLRVADSAGRRVTVGGPKQAALLALLLVHAGKAVPADRLIEDLWDGEPPPTAAKTLQVHVSRLRRLFGEHGANGILETSGGGYALQVDTDAVDALSFERMLAEGNDALAEGRYAEAAQTLRSALALWRGDALADFAYAAFAQSAIARLEGQRVVALESALEAEMALGRHRELIPELDSLVQAHPTSERLRANLMLALYRAGRQADALDVYRTGRTALVDRLGIEPGAELRELERAILAQDPQLAIPADGRRERVSSTRLGSDPLRQTNLPATTQSLIGRDDEIAQLVDLIADKGKRLVTVTGLGGSGKTRLALAAGERLVSTFTDGVWLVSLAEVHEAEGIVPAVADALGVRDEVDRSLAELLVERLSARPRVLILDNVEQLLEAGGPAVVHEVLEQAPRCHILATSQRPLRLPEEVVVRLGPLSPEAARELFVERAVAAVPSLNVAAHAEAIAAVCGRVDGLPLALELAAARVALMSPEELVGRLDDSLRILAGKPDRLRPERQTSMRATLTWTFSLLTDGEAALARRLAAFAGPVPLEAVEHMAAVAPVVDALAGLEGLLDASLVQRRESPEYGLRFAMPQAVRAFAADCLEAAGEESAVRRAHAEHVAEVAAAARFWKASTPAVRARVSALGDEVRPALAWSRVHDPFLRLRLSGAIASWCVHSGRMNESFEDVRDALEAVGDARGVEVGWAKLVLANQLVVHGEERDVPKLVEAGVAEMRASADESRLGEGLRLAAIVCMSASTPGPHREYLDEALPISRRLGDRHRLAVELTWLAQSCWMTGDLDGATRWLDEAEALVDPESYDDISLPTCRADVALSRGDWEAAAAGYARSAAFAMDEGDTGQVFMDLSGLAAALSELGDHGAVIELHSFRRLMKEESGEPDEGMPLVDDEAIVAAARARVSPTEAEAAEARARDLPRHARADRISELGRR